MLQLCGNVVGETQPMGFKHLSDRLCPRERPIGFENLPLDGGHAPAVENRMVRVDGNLDLVLRLAKDGEPNEARSAQIEQLRLQ